MILRLDDELSLQPIEDADPIAYFGLAERSRSELVPWLPWTLRTRTVADVVAYLTVLRARSERDEGFGYALLAEGRFAGAVDVHDINRTHALGQVGYWLGTPFVGRGLMTRAVREVARIAFRNHDLHRLEIFAATENRRSRAVAERAGFALEATLRRRLRGADGWDDCVVYARFADHG